MKRLAIALLVFTTISSFAGSKCQEFVAGLFKRYDLPLPGTKSFPFLGNFNLEKFDQSKPEFTIGTQPIETRRSMEYFDNELTLQKYPQKYSLVFSGRVNQDGTFLFTLSEELAERPFIDDFGEKGDKSKKIFKKNIKRDSKFYHKFTFSKDCKFEGYTVEQTSSLISRYGFRVSADKGCKFDEPPKKDKKDKGYVH